jgi:hypothetical protein
MLGDDPTLKPQYRMPRVFGALPGPRNVPKDKQNLPNRQSNVVLSITALTDAALLSQLLPPDCELDGEPRFTVSLNFMSNIAWLAGHGYAMLVLSVAMKHQHPSKGLLRGNFIPVLWENLADPIITGREELGWPKLYADIPPPTIVGDACAGRALWQGFCFFELELSALSERPISSVQPAGQFHYKYIPRTGRLTEAEVEYLGYCAPGENAAGYAPLSVVRELSGAGSFRFHPARWEDMPFQYPIVNAVAKLPIVEFRDARLVRMAAHLNSDGEGEIDDVLQSASCWIAAAAGGADRETTALQARRAGSSGVQEGRRSRRR